MWVQKVKQLEGKRSQFTEMILPCEIPQFPPPPDEEAKVQQNTS